jgi:hypothetical protein
MKDKFLKKLWVKFKFNFFIMIDESKIQISDSKNMQISPSPSMKIRI